MASQRKLDGLVGIEVEKARSLMKLFIDQIASGPFGRRIYCINFSR